MTNGLQFQAEQQQCRQLRQDAHVVGSDGQSGPGHSDPHTAVGSPVHRHAVPSRARHFVGTRLPGYFGRGRFGPGTVRGAVVLFLQRRGKIVGQR